MRAAFEALHRKRFGYVEEDEPVLDTLTVEAIGSSSPSLHDGRGTTRRVVEGYWPRRSTPPPASLVPSPAKAGEELGPRADLRPGLDHRRRARLAGRARWGRHARPDPRRAARTPARRRHRGRPGAAGNLQQPVHGHRRGNGRRAAVDRDPRQHQGAARFLLRHLRCRRRADRQRAAYSGASRLDGREHPHHHRCPRAGAGTGAASAAATPMC